MKRISKMLIVLVLILNVSQTMASYAMESTTDDSIEPMKDTTIDDVVVMFGKQYHKYDSISDIAIYCREDDVPEQHIIDALRECNLNPAATDYVKMLNIASYICEKLSYDSAAAQLTDKDNNYWKTNPNPFTSECIIEGKAVCAGYAELFQDMCKAIGVECYYITGYVQQGENEPVYHAWNGVTIDGLTYYVDTCWFDGGSNFRWCSTEPLDEHDITAWHEQYRINSKTAK